MGGRGGGVAGGLPEGAPAMPPFRPQVLDESGHGCPTGAQMLACPNRPKAEGGGRGAGRGGWTDDTQHASQTMSSSTPSISPPPHPFQAGGGGRKVPPGRPGPAMGGGNPCPSTLPTPPPSPDKWGWNVRRGTCTSRCWAPDGGRRRHRRIPPQGAHWPRLPRGALPRTSAAGRSLRLCRAQRGARGRAARRVSPARRLVRGGPPLRPPPPGPFEGGTWASVALSRCTGGAARLPLPTRLPY